MANEKLGNGAHKAGPLKQQNKAHKQGRHRSKSDIDKQCRGRVSVKTVSKRVRQLTGKANRRHQARQIRDKKRDEVLEQKRKIGKQGSPPHVIGVVPLSASCDVQKAVKFLSECDDEGDVFHSGHSTTVVSQQLKQRFTLLNLQYGDLYSILDAAKVADTLLFIYTANEPVDVFGEKCLSCLFAQGLPASFQALMGLEDFPAKKRNEVKKNWQKIVEKRFPKDKLHLLDSKQDGLVTLRLLSNQHLRTVHFRYLRPHLLSHDVSFEPNDDTQDVSHGTLKVSGYLRGRTLSVNGLVHLAGHGDFQLKQIDAPADPFAWHKKRKMSSNKANSTMAVDTESGMSEMEQDVKVLARADPALQESLDSEVVPDPMDGEQTWPTEEEIQDAQDVLAERKKAQKKVPKGTSEYQASWIMDSEEESGNEEEDGEEEDDDDDDFAGELKDESESDTSMKEDGDEYDMVSIAATETDDSKYDEKFDFEEEKEQLEKLRAERENEMFPDEIDTPMDVPARVRFQKYRGLKSFRTSPWDPKENLPSDYARIFQFENFKRTRKRVLSEDDADGALAGWYITIHIANVPRTFMDTLDSTKPFVLFGLLPHEQRMTTVHFVLKRHPTFADPIKSKERLIFHCGYRRFTACPIFSQHTSGDKHKNERFLPQEGVIVATVYAPIFFPPCPVLVFTPDKHTVCHTLVATGSLFKVDPDRIVAKKSAISGHPFKINKRSAVVRYMFFNRDDITWFKPVELTTKCGRRGHIREPLGTHGHMKCVFDGPLKAQDTILMNLFKRVFPKWTYEPALLPPPVEQGHEQGVTMET